MSDGHDLPPPGPHGGDGPAIARALGIAPSEILDLSRSANPAAPDVARIARRHLDSLHAYPDPAEARALLAEAIGVGQESLLLTNGGSEAISLVAAEIGGTVVSEPEFGLHPRSDGAARWRSDPHSPTGRLARPDDVADVWDEAYYPIATGRWTAGRPGVAVGSLTKLYDCPGLRLGYVIAEADLVARIEARQPTWSVGSLALAVLPDLLTSTDLPGWASQAAEARAATVAVLRAHGLDPAPSDAPWLLVRAPGLRARLAPRGIVVRDCSSFGLHGWARIGIADDAGRSRLDDALTTTAPSHQDLP